MMIQQVNDFIQQKAKKYERETIEIRKYLHENPELSSEEKKTAKFLKQEIKKYGLTIEEIPGSTGFTALLDTGRKGKTLGIRTDIDALPINENPMNLKDERKYLSKQPGVMHACGHDGHMAIVLTVMRILNDMLEQLSGKIYFIFEEGEEIGSGIAAMIRHLEDKDIDAIYGNHLAAFLDSSQICLDAGPKMAGAVLVDFTVHGTGGHGSRPDLSINPLFAAAHILTGLSNAWANQINVTKTVTLGLTQIHGGSANNVIPDTVRIGGTLRFYDMEEGKRALEIVRKVTDLTAQAHNCTVTFSEDFRVAAQPVINDGKLAEIAERGIGEMLPQSLVKDVKWFASESFNQYAKISPTLFAFIGIRNEEFGSGAEHHNDRFDVDEEALIYGVLATTKFAADFLAGRTE
ncbi:MULTISPECIES: amidohydrolase [unclassified Sporosarcina]|uniref:amidohydrolase n=1 Tax=unclassified Sporosarcina TaxID=2647733 RepID=UPI00203E69AE|nr:MULTISPECIES: amidohydrolase [unclassified Sporosarcina]GKV65885.1 peptidase M20 [Sporosarcina sp. NCCP-2331]GLB56010.1 peptidase M20 [Sporosarcina sp. NCCP-2378]